MNTKDRLMVLKRLLMDFESMSEAQQLSLIRAADGANRFFRDDGFTVFRGDMLVAATLTKSMAALKTDRLMLGMNFMKWLTKFYFTDVKDGFSIVYRTHLVPFNILKTPEYRNMDEFVGTMRQFKPHKPLLSWTTSREPYVEDRDEGPKDRTLILATRVNDKDVIWSYKIGDWAPAIQVALNKAKEWAKSSAPLSPHTQVKGAELELRTKIRMSKHRHTLMSAFLTKLHLLATDMVWGEKEVTLFHGKTNFTAYVVSST